MMAILVLTLLLVSARGATNPSCSEGQCAAQGDNLLQQKKSVSNNLLQQKKSVSTVMALLETEDVAATDADQLQAHATKETEKGEDAGYEEEVELEAQENNQEGEDAEDEEEVELVVEENNQTRGSLTSGSKVLNGRQFFVHVPHGNSFPVLIVLHGSGGTGRDYVNFWKTKSHIANNYILVGPDGPHKRWNIVNEPSKEPDAQLVGNDLVNHLASYSNVEQWNFKLLGYSNGAALINRILIEVDNNRIKDAITCVSQLNERQYHAGKFWIGGTNNTYNVQKTWLRWRKLLQLTGGTDDVIPAGGGPSRIGGLRFNSWENSAYYYATAFGYNGGKKQTRTEGNAHKVDYDGKVIAYNYESSGHSLCYGATAAGPIRTFLGV